MIYIKYIDREVHPTGTSDVQRAWTKRGEEF